VFNIHKDITRSHTLPGSFYKDRKVFSDCREHLFKKSWQLIGHEADVRVPGCASPMQLLEGFIDEPLLLTRDNDDQLHCLSNICTHRGNLLVDGNCQLKNITCSYHGRKFAMDGSFLQMPETKGMKDFPTERDNLPKVPFHKWKNFLFASLTPSIDFTEWISPVEERLGWLPIEDFRFDASKSREYMVKANWALYCDNYLEGFHIPFVHKSLSQELDYGDYNYELFPYANLQLGIAKDGDSNFELPKDSPDYGKEIAAYYFWLFPNLMLNFYPWGLSVNVVKPLEPELTKVVFQTYIWDESKLGRGAGAGLDRVEREDEHIVEQVQKGVRSHFYGSGRFSPKMERGVHHFHRLINGFLNTNNELGNDD